VSWSSPCVTMDIYLGSPPPTLTADQYWNAALLAAQAWSHSDIACTGMIISMTRNEAATATVGHDGKNVLVFRQDNWCQQASPTDPTPPCYPTNAMAVTTLFKRISTGEIVDADMEINAVSFTWADLVADPTQASSGAVDFQNTVTHEMGHVIGLTHSCWTSADGPAPLMDNTGNPELACSDSNLPASVTDATMYPAVATSDVERRTLTPDDQQGACDIYPSSKAICGVSSDGGCSMGGPAESGSGRRWAVGFGAAVGLAFAVAALRRSRRRKTPAPSPRCAAHRYPES